MLSVPADAIVSKNLDGVITSWNRGAERLFGYTEGEAVGQHITLLIPANLRQEEATILERLRRGERVEHFETVRKRKDGTTLDVSLTISPVRNPKGRVVGASKVARDITQQKQAERALRASEERFREIVETTPECVKLVAPDGTLLHMNSSGLTMVGADCADTVVGKSVYDLIEPKDRDRFRAFNERICRGEKGSLEFDIVGLGGERRHMETYAAPLRNPDGTTAQLAVSRDITMRKQAEEAIKEKELSARLLKLQDEERRRIARELHDGVGQLLAAMSMNASRLDGREVESKPRCGTMCGGELQADRTSFGGYSHDVIFVSSALAGRNGTGFRAEVVRRRILRAQQDRRASGTPGGLGATATGL